MTVQRYDLERWDCDGAAVNMAPNPNGDWIRLQDLLALLSYLTAVRHTLWDHSCEMYDNAAIDAHNHLATIVEQFTPAT